MMKKTIFMILLALLMCQPTLAWATPQFTYEEIESNEHNLLSNGIGKSTYIVKEEEYVLSGRTAGSIKYIPGLYEVVRSNNPYIWTGEYYFVRSTMMDEIWDYDFVQPIWFYDKDFRLVYTHDFKTHVMDFGYANGTYYCKLLAESGFPSYVVKSTDMKNWVKTEEEVPHPFGSISYTNTDKVALDGQNFAPVSYENPLNKNLFTTYGEWFVKRHYDDYCFSNDNVYFVKVKYPDELRELDEQAGFGYDLRYIYSYQGQIVIECNRTGWSSFISDPVYLPHANKNVRLFVSEEEVYAELDRQKEEAVYVKLNGELLGFEEMPVRENDRLLVPMRFLFEKLGTQVDWDNDTQTAIATKEGTQISFSIDQVEATVNHQTVQLDAPARLINDKTMIPLRFVSEELGYQVDWDGDIQMATINSAQSGIGFQPDLAGIRNQIRRFFMGWK